MRWDRVVAWTAVVAFHAALLMLLLQLPAPLRGERAEETTLDVVWIAAPRPSAQAQPPLPRAARRAREWSVAPKRRPEGVTASPSETVAEGDVPRPQGADFREQVRLPEPEVERLSVRDPFADRTVRLPGRDARTFRMRPPPSLSERVAAIGRMFGGGDDPCRSARDSINQLSQAGDSRELQDALDYEKRHCR